MFLERLFDEVLLVESESIPYSRPFALYAAGTQTGVGLMYPWSHQAAIEEGLRNMTGMSATDPQCQYVSLTRSSHVGGQRFCSIQWVSVVL